MSYYAVDWLHLLVSLKRGWQLEFEKRRFNFYLLKSTPKEVHSYTIRRHTEAVIRPNMDKVLIVYQSWDRCANWLIMVRPSANTKGDKVIRNVSYPNRHALKAENHEVYCARG